MPLVLADAPDPWPLLLRIARDDERPRNVRSSALLWLSNAVTDHLGISRRDGRESDDDQVREQAVFVLSQRPRSESVPELIDIARVAKNPAARRAAIFWLGQTGDRRAADVFAELLGSR
jgi:HEAT repeat protein